MQCDSILLVMRVSQRHPCGPEKLKPLSLLSSPAPHHRLGLAVPQVVDPHIIDEPSWGRSMDAFDGLGPVVNRVRGYPLSMETWQGLSVSALRVSCVPEIYQSAVYEEKGLPN